MLSLPDRASIEAALHLPLESRLRSLLKETWCRAEEADLLDLTHILVVQPGDTEEAIIEAVGFSPLVNPLDGARYGTADFMPLLAWLQASDGWFHMINPIGDSGFAYILLIEQAEGTLPELLSLCQEYAGGGG